MNAAIPEARLKAHLPPVRFSGSTGDICSSRQTVLASGALRVENSALSSDQPIGHSFSPHAQVVLPYYGAFSWNVGRLDRLVDANAVLFVTGGEEFFEDHPIEATGHGSAILTPSAATLDELRSDADRFDNVTQPISDSIRLTMHALMFRPSLEPLAREELAISLLRDIFDEPGRGVRPVRSIVERAKEMLHAHSHRVLSLDFVSEAVGVTPIHLTTVFTQSVGMPLYRYQMRLRLSRALLELPSCQNLTELALDLGFSSHSHFTATFREAFGISPSTFRSEHAPMRYVSGCGTIKMRAP